LQGLEAAHHPKLAVQRGGLDTRRSDVVWQDRERDRRRSGGGLVMGPAGEGRGGGGVGSARLSVTSLTPEVSVEVGEFMKHTLLRYFTNRAPAPRRRKLPSRVVGHAAGSQPACRSAAPFSPRSWAWTSA